MQRTIGILGFGEIGKAIHHVLTANTELTLQCWDKNVDIIRHQLPLESFVPTCDVIFLCVPTWLIRSATQSIRNFLKPGTIIVSVSKGFEKETCTRVDHLLIELLDKKMNPFVFIAGPMIAEELMTSTPTHAMVVSNDKHAQEIIMDLFAPTTLTMSPSDDLEGIITAASLKNIYALGLGIGDAVNLGANAHGVLITQAIREMMLIISAQGGDAMSAITVAGIGDLVATAQSPNSTNYTTGVRLARGEAPLRGGEAVNTLPCIAHMMKNEWEHLPFMQAINEIVLNKANPTEKISQVIISLPSPPPSCAAPNNT